MSLRPELPHASALSWEDALARLLSLAVPLEESETLPVHQALGRVLAQDLTVTDPVPPWDNAAMDGWAFSSADWQAHGVTTLHAVGAPLLAGHPPPTQPLEAGQAQRIMTGAPLPPGCDTVVPQEWVRQTGEAIAFNAGCVRPGDHRRRAGEDLAAGAVALARGRRLRAADLGVAASMGRVTLPVCRRVRVAFFSTGDELRQPGQTRQAGQIYDSNRASLTGLLQGLPVDGLDLGQVPDHEGALSAAFRTAAEQADVILCSGGVSVGEADHTRAALMRGGTIDFWSVAMQPGRPLAVGTLRSESGRSVPVLGLPGNPVAVVVSFLSLVRPFLLQRAGDARPCERPQGMARAAEAFPKRPGRTAFLRVIGHEAADGVLEVRLAGSQGSGVLHGLTRADALVHLAHARGPVAVGEWVPVWPLEGWL